MEVQADMYKRRSWGGERRRMGRKRRKGVGRGGLLGATGLFGRGGWSGLQRGLKRVWAWS